MARARLLIVCTGNSARSQIAEGLLRHEAGEPFEVFSAGTEPAHIRPEGINVMDEIGAHRLSVAVTGAVSTSKRLGAQMVGHSQSEVARRSDVFAFALYHGMAVKELNNLDLSYTPPLGDPWDGVQMAAQE